MTRCEKDLGILVNNKLSWHDHIVNKVNTANEVLCLIRRSCGSCVIADVIKKLYVHLVRPHLDYASQVWSPHQAYLSDMVEAVQRRATKLMVGNRITYKASVTTTDNSLSQDYTHPDDKTTLFIAQNSATYPGLSLRRWR